MPPVLRAPHTHLYPGLRGRFGPEQALRWSTHLRDQSAVVEFSDGRGADACLESIQADGAHLRVEAYVTAAGTAIPARRWLLELVWEESAIARFRVLRRLPMDEIPG